MNSGDFSTEKFRDEDGPNYREIYKELEKAEEGPDTFNFMIRLNADGIIDFYEGMQILSSARDIVKRDGSK